MDPKKSAHPHRPQIFMATHPHERTLGEPTSKIINSFSSESQKKIAGPSKKWAPSNHPLEIKRRVKQIFFIGV